MLMEQRACAVGGALVSIRVLLLLPLLPVSAVAWCCRLAAATGAERAVGGTLLGWVGCWVMLLLLSFCVIACIEV